MGPVPRASRFRPNVTLRLTRLTSLCRPLGRIQRRPARGAPREAENGGPALGPPPNGAADGKTAEQVGFNRPLAAGRPAFSRRVNLAEAAQQGKGGYYLEDGDVVMVPRGYHPVGAPHGYDLYYLNVMAGPKRQWIFRNDPAHDWIARKA